MSPTDAMELVDRERVAASNKFPPFNSSHEGFAVLKEEVDELWDEVKKNPHKAYGAYEHPEDERERRMRAEAVQVAAMAIRFIMDCT